MVLLHPAPLRTSAGSTSRSATADTKPTQ